jgi:hypothetical protein
MRPRSFLSFEKDLTRENLISGGFSSGGPCSCGKFYIGRTHQQFLERFIEDCNSIEKTLELSKPPKTFVYTLAEHAFFHPEHFVQFDEDRTISNNRGFS